MSEVLRHKMWLKQVLKGFAERVPEQLWTDLAKLLANNVQPTARARIDKVENLGGAYQLGHDFAAMIFGGGDEPS